MEQVKAPSKAIREKCLDCNQSSHEVNLCTVTKCTLYPYRKGKKDFTGYEGESLTPVKSMRQKCIDCHAGNMAEVNRCPLKECALYPYRMGKAPNRKRAYTEEQKQAMAERMKNIRKA